MSSQNVTLCYIDYFKLKAFEKIACTERDFLKIPQTKCRSSRRNSTVIKSPSWEFYKVGKIDSCHNRGHYNTAHPDKVVTN